MIADKGWKGKPPSSLARRPLGIQTKEMKSRIGPKKDGIKTKTGGKLNSSPRSHPARKPVEIAKQSPKDDGHIYRYIRQANKPSKTKKAKSIIR